MYFNKEYSNQWHFWVPFPPRSGTDPSCPWSILPRAPAWRWPRRGESRSPWDAARMCEAPVCWLISSISHFKKLEWILCRWNNLDYPSRVKIFYFKSFWALSKICRYLFDSRKIALIFVRPFEPFIIPTGAGSKAKFYHRIISGLHSKSAAYYADTVLCNFSLT